MFIRIYSDSLQFSAENEILPLLDELGVSDRWINFGEFNTPSILEFSSRVAAQEDIWILNDYMDDGVLNGAVPSFIRNHAIIGQVKSLHDLRRLYCAEERELMLAILNDGLDSTASQKYKDSVLFFSRWWDLYNPTLSEIRSHALAYLTQDLQLADMPYLQLLGYDPDVASNMDTSSQEFVSMQTQKFVRCEAHAKSLIAHLNVAITCALDTPQPVTVTVGEHHITVQNKRVSSHIRGLHIELPTGGFVFYRDAVFKDGSLHFDGRRIASKSPTLSIVSAVATDFLWATRAKSIGMELTDGLMAAQAFATTPISPGIGGTSESQ